MYPNLFPKDFSVFPQEMHPSRLEKITADHNDVLDLSQPQQEPTSALLQHAEWLRCQLIAVQSENAALKEIKSLAIKWTQSLERANATNYAERAKAVQKLANVNSELSRANGAIARQSDTILEYQQELDDLVRKTFSGTDDKDLRTYLMHSYAKRWAELNEPDEEPDEESEVNCCDDHGCE